MSWNYPQTSGIVTPPELEEFSAVKKHPVAVMVHLGLRISTIVAYLLCRFVTDSFITAFVLVTLLSCIDFWTVKNVSGRLLAGLRWWNQVDDDGQSHWVFEAKHGPAANDIVGAESRMFWISLFAGQAVWSLLVLWAIFTFNLKWLLLVGLAFTMSGANLYGYIRCVIGSTSPTDYLKPRLFTSLFKAATASSTSAAEPSQQPQQQNASSASGLTGKI